MEHERFAVRSISSLIAAPYALFPSRAAALTTRYSNSPSTRQKLLNLVFELLLVDNASVRIRNPPPAIDQQSKRQTPDASELFRNRRVADYHRIIQLHLFRKKGLHDPPAFVVHGDAENGQPVLFVIVREFHVPGHLLFAARTPGSPEIEQHNLAPILR